MGQSSSSGAGGVAAIKRKKNRVASKQKDEGDDVKRQIDSDGAQVKPIYQLVDVKTGGGKLIELIKSHRAASRLSSAHDRSGQTTLVDDDNDAQLDEQIRVLVEPLLYNGGAGKLVPLVDLWRHRFNRNAQPSEPGPNAERSLVCWRLEERGFVGETALHICFLLSTPNHMLLARRLLALFPNLVGDTYTSDEYFGESSLHMAIVNEDIRIVKLLLEAGADVHQRCLGTFFLPEDLKGRANGSLRRLLAADGDTEPLPASVSTNAAADETRDHLDLHANHFATPQTNYRGYTYWGEFPLSFAVSLGLADCYKLLLAKGADPNRRDSSGNSSLHLAVIADRIDMFNLGYSSGADPNQLNALALSPLTLAAKLQRVDMFFHILAVRRRVGWILCRVGFVETQLDGIDSIRVTDGACDDNSLLSIVVGGGSNEHLRMLDGFLAELLRVKWRTSVKAKFNSWFRSFLLFLSLSTVAYVTRFKPNYDDDEKHEPPAAALATPTGRAHETQPLLSVADHSWRQLVNSTAELLLICHVLYFLWIMLTRIAPTRSDSPVPGQWWRGSPSVGLRNYLARNALAQAPELLTFAFTCLLILCCVPLRLARLTSAEDSLAALIMFLLPLKLLFFCRASRSSGSFIVMIYKILVDDVLCFVVFMIIFVAGFSQSFLIIFQTHQPKAEAAAHTLSTNATNHEPHSGSGNYFDNLFDAILSMHMMALNEFSLVFDEFDATEYPLLARLLFLVYMVLVSILLINMLIAMLGKTYQDISSQPNENLRQWARALLTVERMWSDSERLALLDRYSHRRVRLPTGEHQNQTPGDGRLIRCYNSTWGLGPADLERIERVEQLRREHRAASAQLAARQRKQQPAPGAIKRVGC